MVAGERGGRRGGGRQIKEAGGVRNGWQGGFDALAEMMIETRAVAVSLSTGQYLNPAGVCVSLSVCC